MARINQLFYIIFSCVFKLLSPLKGIVIGKHVLFKRKPVIQKHRRATIIIGNNTIINSSNKGYHLNMYGRCKIIADREFAEVVIGDHCKIHGACLHAFKSIRIGDNCLIAANTNIIDGNGHALSFDDVDNRVNTKDDGRPINIEDGVWVGANCMILGGVNIGRGSVISAGSIVKNSIPPMCIASGNPAVVIKNYKID